MMCRSCFRRSSSGIVGRSEGNKVAREIGCQWRSYPPGKSLSFPRSFDAHAYISRHALRCFDSVEVNMRRNLTAEIFNLIFIIPEMRLECQSRLTQHPQILYHLWVSCLWHDGKHFRVMEIWWKNSSREDNFHMLISSISSRWRRVNLEMPRIPFRRPEKMLMLKVKMKFSLVHSIMRNFSPPLTLFDPHQRDKNHLEN